MSTHGNNNHGERIATLEAGQVALTASIQKLADIVCQQAETQAQEHSATRREIGGLADRLANYGRPNYGVLIGAAALTCTIVAAIIAPINQRVDSFKESNTEYHASINQNIAREGKRIDHESAMRHAAQAEHISRHQEELDQIQTRLRNLESAP